MKSFDKKKDSELDAAEMFARLLSFVLRLVSPPKCVLCGSLIEEDGSLCPVCLKYYTAAMNRRCPVCAKTARSCTCRPYSMNSTSEVGEKRLIALSFLARPESTDNGDKATRHLVYTVKRRFDRGSVRFCARLLSHEILRHFVKNKEDLSEWSLTYPPRSRGEVVKYGFDQSKQLVRLISRYTGMKMERCFGRRTHKMQKTLNAFERRTNADEAYCLHKDAECKGKKYVIVDDVITTGATVNACANILFAAGAESVFPVCIARTKKRKRLPQRNSPNKLWFKKKYGF